MEITLDIINEKIDRLLSILQAEPSKRVQFRSTPEQLESLEKFYKDNCQASPMAFITVKDFKDASKCPSKVIQALLNKNGITQGKRYIKGIQHRVWLGIEWGHF